MRWCENLAEIRRSGAKAQRFKRWRKSWWRELKKSGVRPALLIFLFKFFPNIIGFFSFQSVLLLIANSVIVKKNELLTVAL